MNAERFELTQSYFGPDESPGRLRFDLFVRWRPTPKPVKPSSREASCAKAVSPEAVAKAFGAHAVLATKLHVTHAHHARQPRLE